MLKIGGLGPVLIPEYVCLDFIVEDWWFWGPVLIPEYVCLDFIVEDATLIHTNALFRCALIVQVRAT